MPIDPQHTLLAFDLDDTLLPEVTYIGAVYEAIAREFKNLPLPHPMDQKKPYLTMGQWANGDKDTLDRMVQIYRTAEGVDPISLPATGILHALAAEGYTLALITDGFSIRQRAKLRLMGITDLFQEIWISEEQQADKLSGKPFATIPGRFPHIKTFTYIGDNPAKDFAPAMQHGWHTIMLKGTPANIHSQHTGTPARTIIESLDQLLAKD
ncbi:MAG: HAD family hydrolase [Barnesiella sp.]|nr:HAD family hydrolase [Barnesiella sp.]